MKIYTIIKPFLLYAMLIALFGGSLTFMLVIEGTAQAAIDSQSLLLFDLEESEATPSLTISNGYKTGLWPTVPVTYTPTESEAYTWLLMEGEPEVTMSDHWTAKISFTTAISTSAATVYYGIYDPDALLPWPHFLRSVKESLSGESRQHQVNLSRLNSLGNKIKEQGGGVIVYRIAITDPRTRFTFFLEPAVRFYDRRFEFYNGQVVPTVSEGPFVDQITEESAIISWDTDRPVENGTVKVEGLGDFSQDNNSSHFEILLTGLSAGTTYTYTVELSDAMTTTSVGSYFFSTPAEDTSHFTFAVMGDSRASAGGDERDFNGVNALAMKELTRGAFNKGSKFIVHTGDMINGYTPSVLNFEMQLQSFKDSVEGVGHYIPIYELMGNHEALINQYQGPGGAADFFYLDKEGDESAEVIFANQFVNPTNGPQPDNDAASVPAGKSLPPYVENVYYFDYGNSRFVMMNNNYWWSNRPEQYGGNLEGYVLDDQMAWLTQVFSDTKSNSKIEHLFLFAQEPMFPNDGHTRDAMWYNGGLPSENNGWDRTYIIERRDEIWRGFVDTGKAVAANFGDEHNYSRTWITKDKDGNDFEFPAWQLISGGAGAPISFEQDMTVPWSDDVKLFSTQLHYTLLRIDGQQVMLDVYNIDGGLIESVILKQADGTIFPNPTGRLRTARKTPVESTSSIVATIVDSIKQPLPHAAIEALSVPQVSEPLMTPLTIPEGYKTGLWPTVPNTYTPSTDEFYTSLLMEGEPEVTMSDHWTAQISFTTAISTSAATVYYGIYDPDALLPWPHFLHSVKESLSGESTQHQLTLTHLNFTSEMTERGGGVIIYRIGLMDPTTPTSFDYPPVMRFYDRRFEFYNGQVVPTVSEGPFVDQITEESAIISWDTDRPVENGTVKVEGLGDFSQDNNSSHFEILLTGLSAGTTYTYTVELSDAMTTTNVGSYFFSTPAEDTSHFTFAVMGDSRASAGGGERNFNGVNALAMRNLTRAAFNKGSEFIVHTGDMINGYTPNVLNFEMQLQSFKDSVEGVGHYIPIYELMGNHEALMDYYYNPNNPADFFQLDKEGDESTEIIFANQFVNPTNGPQPDNDAASVPAGKSLPPYVENVYYFDYGNSRFVMMNNNYWWSSRPEQYGGNLEGYVLDDQMAWLTQVFSDTKNNSKIEHLFLFAQEPMFPNDGHTRDAMWYSNGTSDYPCNPSSNCLPNLDRTYIIERRDEIWRGFVGTGKAVAANFGDEHNYSRTLITEDRHGNNFEYPVWQIISGGAGAPISLDQDMTVPWSDDVKLFSTQLHYTLFTVDSQQVMLDVYSIDGELIERVQLAGEIVASTIRISHLSSTSPSELAWPLLMALLPLSMLVALLIMPRWHKPKIARR